MSEEDEISLSKVSISIVYKNGKFNTGEMIRNHGNDD